MRTKPSKTIEYFNSKKVSFLDTTIVIGKNKLHYIQTGKKGNPILLFVHGSPGSWDNFEKYLSDSLLLKKYYMIAVDRPGFGYSDFRKSKDLFAQTAILKQFVKTLPNNLPIYSVGHSYGGPIVTNLAIEMPNRFTAIVLLAGAVDPKAETPEKWRKLFVAKPLRYIVPGALQTANDELWWLKQDLYVMQKNLNKLTTNVLVIHGTKDNLVPYSNVAFVEREFINAKTIEVVTIKNANHFIPWEHFETIRQKLLDLK
jgi:pimeloyl-ACP methyl ester carboxylesterase